MEFPDRESFRNWLRDNCLSDTGIWLLFGKAGGPETISAAEALEEALCFGWIDGRMQSIDDKSYKKYFSVRRPDSEWSGKNRALAEELERRGAMTVYGRKKIEEARKDGRWDAPAPQPVTEEQTASLAALLKEHEPARTNFMSMSLSVKKTYARAYLDAKTDAGRAKRLSWIIGRLDKNLKPM